MAGECYSNLVGVFYINYFFILSTGNVTWIPPAIIRSSCRIDVRNVFKKSNNLFYQNLLTKSL